VWLDKASKYRMLNHRTDIGQQLADLGHKIGEALQ
jgi:hypothetical protein